MTNYLYLKGERKEMKLTDLSQGMIITDQAGQSKYIISATIMEYNKNTVFGIGVDGKKLWLGKYDTVEKAEKVKNIINTSLIEKRIFDLRYLELDKT